MKTLTDSAYILHSKPFRDTKKQLEVFTQNNGIISAIVMQRSTKKSTYSNASIQPLQEVFIEFELKINLSKIIQITIPKQQITYHLKHFILYQYFQELLLSLLPKQTTFSKLYIAYQISLKLIDNQFINFALRQFEIALLIEFSALIDVFFNHDKALIIQSDKNYYFNLYQGLVEKPLDNQQNKLFTGLQLKAFKQTYETVTHYFHNLSSTQHFLESSNTIDYKQSLETAANGAKPITQFLINELLQGKPLKTRALYKRWVQ